MSAGGSVQLRLYRQSRAALGTIAAAQSAGITIAEARLIDRDDERDPPPPEAFEPITNPTPAGQPGSDEEEPAMVEADSSLRTESIAAQLLRLFVERVERLEEEKKGIADDIKEVFSEMKGRGYDTKIVRKLLAMRRRKTSDIEEERMILETYCSALGMQLSFL